MRIPHKKESHFRKSIQKYKIEGIIVKFSEEMKMMLQIEQIEIQNQKKASLKSVQDDYNKLIQKILSCLKMQIRKDMEEKKFSYSIEGDCELSNSPNVKCLTIPTCNEKSELYSYQTIDNISYFCWTNICHGIKDGKRLASKNICVELTEAGKQLLSDLASCAAEEGILLEFQPALDTKNGKVILPKFGKYENVPKLKIGRNGTLNEYFVNMHYRII